MSADSLSADKRDWARAMARFNADLVESLFGDGRRSELVELFYGAALVALEGYDEHAGRLRLPFDPGGN